MISARWRAMQRDALIKFAAGAVKPSGFGYLDAQGRHQVDHGVELWINGRFTHVFACEVIRGNKAARPYLDLGMRALTTSLRDPIHDGWFAAVATGDNPGDIDRDGHAQPFKPSDTIKQSYSQAFVILAAASALQAGHPQAKELFDHAHRLNERYWWEESVGRVRESYPRDWSITEKYRGINANMHMTECLLASFDATGDIKYLQRALGIVRFVMCQAAKDGFRIQEHYDENWVPNQDYNREKPADPFRPWGATVGHAFEWARLALQAGIVAYRKGILDLGTEDQARVFVHIPLALIAAAEVDGWAVDGAEGFVYTTDFSGQPIVHERMHWVVCEAINAVHVARRTLAQLDANRVNLQLNKEELADPGESSGHPVGASNVGASSSRQVNVDTDRLRANKSGFIGQSIPKGHRFEAASSSTVDNYCQLLQSKEDAWWEYAEKYLISEPGRWYEELDRHNKLSERTWVGMPEIYHAYQALVLPDGDYATGFAKAATI